MCVCVCVCARNILCVVCASIAICMYWYGFMCNCCCQLHSHLMCSAFYSLCYSADCSCLLAAGRSKFICIYSCQHQVLLKKFLITRNRSFDGMRVCCGARHTSVHLSLCTLSLCVVSLHRDTSAMLHSLKLVLWRWFRRMGIAKKMSR